MRDESPDCFLSRDDSVGREFRCAADFCSEQGPRHARIKTWYGSAENEAHCKKTKQMNRDSNWIVTA